MKKSSRVLKNIFYIFIAILIPGLLILNAIQAERYMKVEREVRALEKKQVQLVEENKKLITEEKAESLIESYMLGYTE